MIIQKDASAKSRTRVHKSFPVQEEYSTIDWSKNLWCTWGELLLIEL